MEVDSSKKKPQSIEKDDLDNKLKLTNVLGVNHASLMGCPNPSITPK